MRLKVSIFLLVMLSIASQSGWSLSLEKEIEKGRLEHQKVIAQFGIYRDAKLQDYVNQVGQRIAKESTRTELTYTFTLLNDDMINAFALPGGMSTSLEGCCCILAQSQSLRQCLATRSRISQRNMVSADKGVTRYKMWLRWVRRC